MFQPTRNVRAATIGSPEIDVPKGAPIIMKRIVLLAAALVAAAAVAATAMPAQAKPSETKLTGAGSSFVFPLVSKWIPALGTAYGYDVTYAPVGSGAGIAQITARTVDFGASDAPLTPDQFAACNGCVQIPWALSATSIAYNVPNAPTGLRLNGSILAKVYLGRITNWNDAAIRKLNPSASLPDLKITPVYRSDNSGTSYNFTDYLSAVNGEWKSKVGVGVNANWPAGVGAKGSSGVAGVVARTAGAITYVDVAYSLQNRLKFARVLNRAGKFQLPGLRGIKAAGAAVTKVPANGELSIVNPPKSQPLAYPISTYTYVILPKRSSKALELRKMVYWALTQGQQYGPKLLFQPLPKAVQAWSYRTIKQVQG